MREPSRLCGMEKIYLYLSYFERLSIRILLYDNDIVILDKQPNVLQGMISRLEKYCEIELKRVLEIRQ